MYLCFKAGPWGLVWEHSCKGAGEGPGRVVGARAAVISCCLLLAPLLAARWTCWTGAASVDSRTELSRHLVVPNMQVVCPSQLVPYGSHRVIVGAPRAEPGLPRGGVGVTLCGAQTPWVQAGPARELVSRGSMVLALVAGGPWRAVFTLGDGHGMVGRGAWAPGPGHQEDSVGAVGAELCWPRGRAWRPAVTRMALTRGRDWSPCCRSSQRRRSGR